MRLLSLLSFVCHKNTIWIITAFSGHSFKCEPFTCFTSGIQVQLVAWAWMDCKSEFLCYSFFPFFLKLARKGILWLFVNLVHKSRFYLSNSHYNWINYFDYPAAKSIKTVKRPFGWGSDSTIRTALTWAFIIWMSQKFCNILVMSGTICQHWMLLRRSWE